MLLPYVSGIVKESLRLALANPTRLPRIVPEGGLHVPGLPVIPSGTSVGIGAFTLHCNPKIFPRPESFEPERWLDPTPEMLRDSFYFGMGTRQCIARNFATIILRWAAEAIIKDGILSAAQPVAERINILEYFNARVVGGKVELRW